jgi:hypothetical protein
MSKSDEEGFIIAEQGMDFLLSVVGNPYGLRNITLTNLEPVTLPLKPGEEVVIKFKISSLIREEKE